MGWHTNIFLLVLALFAVNRIASVQFFAEDDPHNTHVSNADAEKYFGKFKDPLNTKRSLTENGETRAQGETKQASSGQGSTQTKTKRSQMVKNDVKKKLEAFMTNHFNPTVSNLKVTQDTNDKCMFTGTVDPTNWNLNGLNIKGSTPNGDSSTTVAISVSRCKTAKIPGPITMKGIQITLFGRIESTEYEKLRLPFESAVPVKKETKY